MIKPLVTPAQMVQNTLTNRAPVRCPICERYVATFAGLPVILDNKEQIIAFAHPGCCAHEESTSSFSPDQERTRCSRNQDEPAVNGGSADASFAAGTPGALLVRAATVTTNRTGGPEDEEERAAEGGEKAEAGSPTSSAEGELVPRAGDIRSALPKDW